MMRRRTLITTTAAGLFLFACSTTNTLANEEGLSISAKGGTLGAGFEIGLPLLPNTRIRGGYNYLSYSFDSTISEINYDYDSTFQSFSLFFDWHPFGGVFFLSGGALFNNNQITATGTIRQNQLPAALSSYAALADSVSLTGDIDFNPVAPYLGLGWRSNSGEKGWGFACDLGVMFQGEPDVSNLRVKAPIDVNSQPDVKSFLAEQENEIEDDLSTFKYYPVASLMLIYTF